MCQNKFVKLVRLEFKGTIKLELWKKSALDSNHLYSQPRSLSEHVASESGSLSTINSKTNNSTCSRCK